MAELLRQAPPIAYYTAISVALLGIVVARALDTYHNFFAAAFALSHSNGSIMVMANMAALSLYLFGRALQFLFFGPLRPVEVERLYQRGGFFVTDFMLAFATFREAFGISSGVMVSILLFAKCFHWLLADRIEAIDQLPYPGPSRLEHARLLALFLVLWICDLILLTYSVDAAMQKGIGLVVLFAAEYAILVVNLTQCLLKYTLSVVEIRRAARFGGLIAPPWEDKPIYGFYIELSTAFIELTIYLTYFVLMSIYHSIPVYAIRDVYVAGSLFFTRSFAFVRYKRAMRALDVFPTPTQQELDSKSDKTCIVCREELVAIPPEGQSATNVGDQPGQNNNPELDTSNGPPKRLACGHIFHLNCLRSWFERQLTCPTCRRRIEEPRPAGNGQNIAGGIPGAVPGLAGNIAGDIPRQQPQPPAGLPDHQPRPTAGNVGRQPNEINQTQMREPLRFEGFYLQAGSFVPWIGGPLLPRDPTQAYQPLTRQVLSTQQQQQQNRQRQPIPPTSLGVHDLSMPMRPPTYTTPVSPIVQAPPTFLTATTPLQPTPTTTIPSTTMAPAATTVDTPQTGTKSSVVEDEVTSSDSSSSDGETADSIAKRRQMMLDAAMQRQSRQSTPAPSTSGLFGLQPVQLTPTTPLAGHTSRPPSKSSFEQFFAIPNKSTPEARPAAPVDLSATEKSGTNPSRPASAQYCIRYDAPSFVPLFHTFHLQHFGPAAGPSKQWPMQQTFTSARTAPLTPSPAPTNLAHPQPNASLQTPASLGAKRPWGLSRNVTPQINDLSMQGQAPSVFGLSQLRPSSTQPLGEAKPASSTSQETSLQELDTITRQQVEARIKVLENVKRVAQQCIDDLLSVREPSIGITGDGRPKKPESEILGKQESSTVTLAPEPAALVPDVSPASVVSPPSGASILSESALNPLDTSISNVQDSSIPPEGAIPSVTPKEEVDPSSIEYKGDTITGDSRRTEDDDSQDLLG